MLHRPHYLLPESDAVEAVFALPLLNEGSVTRGPLTRNMLLYWMTDTMASVTDVIFSVALALTAVEYGRSAWASGVILFTASVPYAAFGLIGGVVADRFDKRHMMIVTDIVRAIVIGLIPVAAAWHALTVGGMMVASVLATTARTVYFPARKGVAPALLSQAEALGRFNLYLNASASLGTVLVPALGSLVVLWTHQVVDIFYIPAASLSISALGVALMKVSVPGAPSAGSPWTDLIAGLRHVFSA